MAINWGGALDGGVKGGETGSVGGPWGAGIGAVIGALLGAFRKKNPKEGQFDTGSVVDAAGGFNAMKGGAGGGGGASSYASMIPQFLSNSERVSQNDKNGLDENGSPAPRRSSMFSPETLTKAMDLFGGGADEGAPAEEGASPMGMDISKLLPRSPSFGGATPLMGFSMRPSLSERLKGTLASRRGF